MKIGIDLTALLPQPTGVDTFLHQLVLHLAAVDRDNHYTLFVNYEDRRLFDGQLPPTFRRAVRSLRARPARLVFQQGVLPLSAARHGMDVVHSPSFIMPMWRSGRRHVLTVYDLTSFSLPSCHIPLRRSAAYRSAVQRSIARADLVSVPSAAVRAQILDLMPEVDMTRVRIVTPGISERFRIQPADRVRREAQRLGLPDRYILHVGTIEPRKNLVMLVEAYRAAIRAGEITEDLVLAGRLGWDYAHLLALVNAPDLRGRVHLRGYVDDADLPWIYAAARLFIYPSLWEGFGFPPLEAAACGVPVIVSNGSALAENLEGAAELVSPTDGPALSAAMRRLLSDETLRAARRELGLARAAQFRWAETARAMRACYEAAASR